MDPEVPIPGQAEKSDQTQKAAAVTSAYPPPPPFWRSFASQNLERFERSKKEYIEKNQDDKDTARLLHGGDAETLKKLELPHELQYLIPPGIPEEDTKYTLFGETQKAAMNIGNLKDHGIEAMYDEPPQDDTTDALRDVPPNASHHLTVISKYLLLNFLELVGLLSRCPERYEAKLDDIRNLFINAHHLLNLYRPHQTRESLIMMMEEQLKKSKEEISEMDRVKAKTEQLLQRFVSEDSKMNQPRKSSLLSSNFADENGTITKATTAEEWREIWNLVNKSKNN